jgi:F-type H+-transporting ATPase subunit delta
VSRIAIRYSKALFELTLEKESLAVVENDLLSIKNLIEENNDLKNFIVNPLISARSKTEIMKKIFQDSVDQLTLRFLILLSSKKRSEFLLEVIERFEALALDHKGILSVQLYSAVPLAAEQKEAIQKRLEKNTGKTVRLTEIIENSLVGGFIVKIHDSVIDYSLRRQLEKLRKKMIYG